MSRKDKNYALIAIIICLANYLWLNYFCDKEYYRTSLFIERSLVLLGILVPALIYQEIKDYWNKKNDNDDERKNDDDEHKKD